MIEGVRWFQEGNPKHLKDEMLLKMFLFLLGSVFLIRWQNLLRKLCAEKHRGLPSFLFLLSSWEYQSVPTPKQLAGWNWYSPFLTGPAFRGKAGICHCCVACGVWQGDRHLLGPYCWWPHTSSGWSQASLRGWEVVEKCDGSQGVWVCPCVPSCVGQQAGFPTPLIWHGLGIPNTESELCAKIVGFQEQLYCVLWKSIGLE